MGLTFGTKRLMKLIVQIPCYNEATTLPQTVASIPRKIDGVHTVEILIVDDGSTDGTREVAESIDVDHLVSHKRNLGLGRAFRTGLEACIARGADIIVNTDGDNQYAGRDIARLVEPILNSEADIVIGTRDVAGIQHFSPLKKWLHFAGSALVRRLSRAGVGDTVSGFRALSREAAVRMNLVSTFSYTIEMLMSAEAKGLRIAAVPVRTNPKTRESRLFRSIPEFLQRSVRILFRTYTMNRPLHVFVTLSAVLAVVGVVPIVRFLYLYFAGNGAGHVQSLVVGGVFVVTGILVGMLGVLADLISINRELVERVLYRLHKLEEPWSHARRGGSDAVGNGEGESGEAEAYDGTRPAVDCRDDSNSRRPPDATIHPRRDSNLPPRL